ncbi:GTPase HflX [Fructilactobacillus fructivorans]|uniref:GTPase HflX n=1 Tax=Fructilactobacillus fructivorans TaxID=1614 RepID=A0AAE6TVV1_9LACO|nr:GTPase HflX [Fructilactobacillus fructivorans]KRK57158.1 GTP-binding protein [Fructilactobacillus fructivorans]QFX92354.1 GTPase HflX [Fructilactobacillus fructivorans]RDV64906.1 GTPase HflX [Fructilactobacillus fructivorans]
MNDNLTDVITIGLDLNDANFQYSMEELNNLVTANNMQSVETVTQKLDHPDPATYFGKGKVEFLEQLVKTTETDVIVANDELSPSQIRNLEKLTNAKIIDRTGLILEIFANRARSREAKLQVQLAKLNYQLPRLRTSASQRLDQQSAGGGLANRGAGETQIELNRRTIQHQINHVRHELKEIDKSYDTQSKKRKQNDLKTIALVGYTNAGKSTIMNQLVKRFGENEDKEVTVKNMLFATLDTSVRKIELPNHKRFLATDTVGFVSQLPHQLIQAFKSTLAEAANADLLIQVVDYSDPNQELMMQTTEATLKEIGVPDIPMIKVFNKADKSGENYPVREGNNIIISALDPSSINRLVDIISENLFKDYIKKTYLVPFSNGQVVSDLNENETVYQTDYTDQGTVLRVELPETSAGKYKKYEVNE